MTTLIPDANTLYAMQRCATAARGLSKMYAQMDNAEHPALGVAAKILVEDADVIDKYLREVGLKIL